MESGAFEIRKKSLSLVNTDEQMQRRAEERHRLVPTSSSLRRADGREEERRAEREDTSTRHRCRASVCRRRTPKATDQDAVFGLERQRRHVRRDLVQMMDELMLELLEEPTIQDFSAEGLMALWRASAQSSIQPEFEKEENRLTSNQLDPLVRDV
ncbi:hypothetical protein EYF80_014185 [Liparis tanakae]|uniref:Uncharacterized protein n=1 Tax=Liparis tanakae TaxID=230148 RepID=A0A4Z2IDL0_9TELE|nr:hypothetical protein EYF80_014185 [Liparis tanakae]